MKKVIIPLLVLAIGFGLSRFIIATAPEAKKKPTHPSSTVVETQPLQLSDYPLSIKASGVVHAQTQTNLVAEVAGKVIAVSPRFQAGSYFEKGEELLRIDDANYRNAITIAEGELAQRKLTLAEQQAQAKLAAKDWQLFEDKQRRPQDDFAARRPHIAAAKANINAAQARLEQEQRNLERTVIRAPYAGRIQEKRVDIGQYVSPNTVLGVAYATDYVEVHLPLSLAQYDLLDIPEAFRDQTPAADAFPSVEFSTSSNAAQRWQGKIVRSSATLDAKSRQITVIARIDNPYESSSGTSRPIRIGQYVNASIQAQTLEKVYVVPPSAVRQGREILLEQDNQVQIVPVELLWSNEQEMVVRTQLDLIGKSLITTPLPLATQGARVEVLGQDKPAKKSKPAQAEQPKTQPPQED